MIYGEDHSWRNTIIILVLLTGVLFAGLWYTNKLPEFLNFDFLKTQVADDKGNVGNLQNDVISHNVTPPPDITSQMVTIYANYQYAAKMDPLSRAQATNTLLSLFMKQLFMKQL